MKSLFVLLLSPFLIFTSTEHAEAGSLKGPFSYGEKLLYVQNLQSDAPEFRNLSLCKLADFHTGLFTPTTLEANSASSAVKASHTFLLLTRTSLS